MECTAHPVRPTATSGARPRTAFANLARPRGRGKRDGGVSDGLGSGIAEVPHFHQITGHHPYPWQHRLYAALVHGAVPDAVDIPTGLGKTLCVLVLLLARLRNPALPRRIVYVVDRRAIVDQTADAIRVWIERIGALPRVARQFDACAAFPAERPVQLGVLRGGLGDDGAWRVDPARPAVVVGTVDMIGSRLLFSGYGDGRWARPMHAGLLAHDAIVVLDEAHLSPAMGGLLRAIEALQRRREFRTMTLSATAAASANGLGLAPADFASPALRRRLHAAKTLRFVSVATPKDRIAHLCDAALAHRTGAIAVFVRTVADARRIAARLARALSPDRAERVALLTGTLRGRERAALCEGAVWRRFRPGRERTHDAPSVYLVTTAAGEVGVDLDADHAVMDLSPLDSIIQRIGRVNRTGAGSATITVVFSKNEAQRPKTAPKTFRDTLHVARARTLATLRGLADVSPATLHGLDKRTLETCTVPRARPARLDAVVVEAFAATSTPLPLPPVAVYLRGVCDEHDVPETFLAWRWDIPDLVALGADAARAALSFYRPHPDELARVPAPNAAKLLERAIARQCGRGLPLVVVKPGAEVFAAVVVDAAALPALGFATVLLPPGAGGLTPSGLPDADAAHEVTDVADRDDRIRCIEPHRRREDETGGSERARWLDEAITLRIPMRPDGEAQIEERFLVYALRRPDTAAPTGELEPNAPAASTQTVDEHCARVGAAAKRIGEALGLAPQLIETLETAGAWHDRGKARRAWQRAAGMPLDGPPLAKSTRARFRPEWLGGYRHEFGSLADAERGLGAGVANRDLVLHLVAAHHGWARPGFPRREQWDPDDASRTNLERAVRTAHRFARLQAQHGPWRLAWLEALVKAADAWVSSRPAG